MSIETMHTALFINHGIPRETSIDEFHDWLIEQTGGNFQDPDSYLFRERKPDMEDLAERFLAWRLNHPSELS